MSRNQLGARLPPPPEGRQEVPKLLPDGSESQHHNGSFGAYMAHKERKLEEQFQAAAAGQQRTRLFEGVAIHVDGFTNPSHLVGAGSRPPSHAGSYLVDAACSYWLDAASAPDVGRIGRCQSCVDAVPLSNQPPHC